MEVNRAKANAGEPNTRKELLRTGEEGAKGADPQLSSMWFCTAHAAKGDTYIEHWQTFWDQ
jgi:hypothetical protein